MANGAPEDTTRLLTTLLVAIRDGHAETVADGVERALGRSARSFEDFVREAAAAGAWDPGARAA